MMIAVVASSFQFQGIECKKHRIGNGADDRLRSLRRLCNKHVTTVIKLLPPRGWRDDVVVMMIVVVSAVVRHRGWGGVEGDDLGMQGVDEAALTIISRNESTDSDNRASTLCVDGKAKRHSQAARLSKGSEGQAD